MIFMEHPIFRQNATSCSETCFLSQKKEVQKFLWSEMPRNTVIDPNRVDHLVLGGGLKQDTLKRRERAYKALDDFLRAQYQVTADDALKSSQLEDVLMSYFESLRVQQKDDKGELVDDKGELVFMSAVLYQIVPIANT